MKKEVVKKEASRGRSLFRGKKSKESGRNRSLSHGRGRSLSRGRGRSLSRGRRGANTQHNEEGRGGGDRGGRSRSLGRRGANPQQQNDDEDRGGRGREGRSPSRDRRGRGTSPRQQNSPDDPHNVAAAPPKRGARSRSRPRSQSRGSPTSKKVYDNDAPHDTTEWREGPPMHYYHGGIDQYQFSPEDIPQYHEQPYQYQHSGNHQGMMSEYAENSMGLSFGENIAGVPSTRGGGKSNGRQGGRRRLKIGLQR